MADTESPSHTEVDLESLEKHDIPQETIHSYREIQKPEQLQLSASPEAPEGGTKAWLCVLGASAGLFTSFGWTNCIGLFQDEYQSNQLKGYSSSTVSWITSVQCMYLPSSFDMGKSDEGKFSSCWAWPPWQAGYSIAMVPASRYLQGLLRMFLVS